LGLIRLECDYGSAVGCPNECAHMPQHVANYKCNVLQEKMDRDKTTNELYSNQISPEYFAQFGTSHR
jgi:hypothetical protein